MFSDRFWEGDVLEDSIGLLRGAPNARLWQTASDAEGVSQIDIAIKRTYCIILGIVWRISSAGKDWKQTSFFVLTSSL